MGKGEELQSFFQVDDFGDFSGGQLVSRGRPL